MQNRKLAVFATYGNSLESWREAGILDREMALYDQHAKRLSGVLFFSYGGKEDLEIAKRYEYLTVLSNQANLHPRLYALFGPLMHRKRLLEADLFKTNQLYGAHIASRAAALCGRKLIVRQGYGHYEHRVEEKGASSSEAKAAFAYERKYLSGADAVVFTSYELAERAARRHQIPESRLNVIPNYIDPRLWTGSRPLGGRGSEKFELVFFGRFVEQKNLQSLIAACVDQPVRLTLIGEGPLEEALRSLAGNRGVDCRFIPRQSQEKLLSFLEEADAFALPSHYEGHPKSLIEAMAFGMPILAADSPGIQQVVKHAETGILAEPTAEALAVGLSTLMQMSASDRKSLGEKAQAQAVASYCVEAIADKEFELFQKLVSN